MEIQTKLASVLPFLLGTVYAVYRFGRFNVLNFIIMFISLICFDMAVTGINNYIDFKTANKKEGYGYERHNAMVRYGIKSKTAVKTIAALLTTATAAGFILFLLTNAIVLAFGVICFIIGITYTYGPAPTSRTPFGEALSGFVMGFVIIFLSAYIHVYETSLMVMSYYESRVIFEIDIKEMIFLIIFSIPSIMSISNIMLANNICDMEDDTANGRKTLPLYIGEKYSLYLFGALYLIAYISIILIVIAGAMPYYYLLGLLSSAVVFKNISVFNKKHVKEETFVLSVKNFVYINLLNLLIVIFCVIL